MLANAAVANVATASRAQRTGRPSTRATPAIRTRFQEDLIRGFPRQRLLLGGIRTHQTWSTEVACDGSLSGRPNTSQNASRS